MDLRRESLAWLHFDNKRLGRAGAEGDFVINITVESGMLQRAWLRIKINTTAVGTCHSWSLGPEILCQTEEGLMGRWWHTANIHLVLTSGKKLCLVECVGSLGIFYWLFWFLFFFFLFLVDGWTGGTMETSLWCCWWFSFQTVFYTSQLLWCCDVAGFWFWFVFQSSCKSEKIMFRVCDGCGSYKNVTQLRVSDKAHCLLAATRTFQSIFSLPLLLTSSPSHSDDHHHLQSGCCCSNRILLWGFRMWRCEKVK